MVLAFGRIVAAVWIPATLADVGLLLVPLAAYQTSKVLEEWRARRKAAEAAADAQAELAELKAQLVDLSGRLGQIEMKIGAEE